MDHWKCGRYTLALDRPLIMGVVNVTPDSFSDGGRFASVDAAVDHARRLVEEGADILDIGGESTRPRSAAVALDEERVRVLPVLERVRELRVPISVDTRKPELMREAVAAGASIINDISALEADRALEALAHCDVGVCLMHKRGEPANMQDDPQYADVVGDVREYLGARIDAAVAAGIARDRLSVDPGFGFGKTLDHNIALLRGLSAIASLDVPVLVGVSRKGMIGTITGRPVTDRLAGSIAAAMLAVEAGARIVRVHDVSQTRDALAVWEAVRGRIAAP